MNHLRLECALAEMTGDTLRDVCLAYNLRVGGSKADLVDRLSHHVAANPDTLHDLFMRCEVKELKRACEECERVATDSGHAGKISTSGTKAAIADRLVAHINAPQVASAAASSRAAPASAPAPAASPSATVASPTAAKATRSATAAPAAPAKSPGSKQATPAPPPAPAGTKQPPAKAVIAGATTPSTAKAASGPKPPASPAGKEMDREQLEAARAALSADARALQDTINALILDEEMQIGAIRFGYCGVCKKKHSKQWFDFTDGSKRFYLCRVDDFVVVLRQEKQHTLYTAAEFVSLYSPGVAPDAASVRQRVASAKGALMARVGGALRDEKTRRNAKLALAVVVLIAIPPYSIIAAVGVAAVQYYEEGMKKQDTTGTAQT